MSQQSVPLVQLVPGSTPNLDAESNTGLISNTSLTVVADNAGTTQNPNPSQAVVDQGVAEAQNRCSCSAMVDTIETVY